MEKPIRTAEIEHCLACGTRGEPVYEFMHDVLFDAPGVWRSIKCPNDGLIWLSPRPLVEDLWRVYETYYTHSDQDVPRTLLRAVKAHCERVLLQREFGYGTQGIGQSPARTGRAVKLIPMASEMAGSSVMWLRALPDGKLLDVGCGTGGFLQRMQTLGWKVAGVEPDEKAAALARERLGVLVTSGTIESARYERDAFDAVTAHHVIEHVHDPIEFLLEAYRILKPGGRLVVTTPNVQSMGHRVFTRDWRGLEVPRHLHLFSTATLRSCAEKAGYEIEVLRTSARSAWEIWCASRLIRRDGRIPGGFPRPLARRLLLEGLLVQCLQHAMLLVDARMGEALVFVGRKRIAG